jgi:purine-binding chemotaxis protein CheW
MSTNPKEEIKIAGGYEQKFQIVIFRLGSEEYALNIDQIKEVVRTPSITRMPQSLEYIKGVANIRGNIIAIIDLEEKFELKTTSNGSTDTFTLVVESDEYKMGILVNEVPNTLAILPSDLDQTMVAGESEQSYIKGIVKLGSRLIILIDIFKVMSMKEMGQALNKAVAA